MKIKIPTLRHRIVSAVASTTADCAFVLLFIGIVFMLEIPFPIAVFMYFLSLLGGRFMFADEMEYVIEQAILEDRKIRGIWDTHES